MNIIRARCAKALNIIKFVRGTWWGADPNTLIVLYKSFVRPIINYGAVVYYPVRKSDQGRLESIQNSTIRMALGFRKSTPLNLLLAESKLESLFERAMCLGNKYMAKIMSNSNLFVFGVVERMRKSIKIEGIQE